MIRLEGLRVQAGAFSLAIDDLSIAPGEYVMILGPTASGKTVLLETVAGLRRPRGGQVWFGERDVTDEPPEKRGAGLVYQDYALFPHLTVANNIAFGLRSRRPRGARKGNDSRVRELAGLLGIDGLLGRYPEGLSGGEQQRVALARALAIEPEVLLLDEPLSALDGPTRLELQRELKRVHRQLGAMVMHVTHDLDEALALGDRVAVLIGGDLRQVGVPQDVTRCPVDVEVARLVGLTNVFPIGQVPEEGGFVRLECGWEIATEGIPPARSSGKLFAVIRAEEIDIQRLDGQLSEAPGKPEGNGTSGRDNILDGVVKAVRLQSVHACVEVEVTPVQTAGAPVTVTVHVLRPQVEKMGLVVGSSVRLGIPPSAVHLTSCSR